jgi:DNA-binding NarL/FixJ family response regulator
LEDFRLHDADTLLRAIRLARHHQPSTLVVEAIFAGPSTLELLVEIEDDPMIQGLILTHCAIPWVAQVLLEHGAKGYLLKSDSPERCLSAIERVVEGEGGWISQKILSGLYSRYDAVGPSVDVARKALTIREWEIMIMAARGQKNARMAEEFCISVGTVKNHLYHVFDKLSMSSRLDLIAWAQDRSIFRLGVKCALAVHPSCEWIESPLDIRCDRQ